MKSLTRQDNSPALARREQIIEAARAVIEEHGPDALTGQIADRAGLARPNFYRHFASKDELDFEVARSAYQELHAEILSKMDAPGTSIEVIRAPIAAQVIWAGRHPNLYRFLVSRGYQPGPRPQQGQRRDFTANIVAAGARHFPHFADNRRAAADLIVAISGLIDASILAWLNRRGETRKALIERLTQQAWLLIDQHLRAAGVRLESDKSVSRTKTTTSVAESASAKPRPGRRPATAKQPASRTR